MASIITESNENEYILIPRSVIDKHLTTATFESLKVLLWLLANPQKTADSAFVSNVLGVDEKELYKAIDFWVSKKVLKKRGERISLTLGSEKEQSPPQYTGEIINIKIKENAELLKLIEKISEEIYSKVLSPTEVQLIVSLYDWLGLPADVIFAIVEYCTENEKTNLRYIEKTAVSFSDMGLTTIEKVKHYINEQKYKKTMESKISTVIGAGGRALTESEKKSINLWVFDYGFDTEIIKYAYELTVEKTGKYSISYMSTILRAWHDKGYKVISDAKNEPSPKKSNGSSKKKTSYDLEENFKSSWTLIHNDDEE